MLWKTGFSFQPYGHGNCPLTHNPCSDQDVVTCFALHFPLGNISCRLWNRQGICTKLAGQIVIIHQPETTLKQEDSRFPYYSLLLGEKTGRHFSQFHATCPRIGMPCSGMVMIIKGILPTDFIQVVHFQGVRPIDLPECSKKYIEILESKIGISQAGSWNPEKLPYRLARYVQNIPFTCIPTLRFIQENIRMKTSFSTGRCEDALQMIVLR